MSYRPLAINAALNLGIIYPPYYGPRVQTRMRERSRKYPWRGLDMRAGRRSFRDRNATNRLATRRRSLDCSNAPPWCPKRVNRMEKFLLPETKNKESIAKKTASKRCHNNEPRPTAARNTLRTPIHKVLRRRQ